MRFTPRTSSRSGARGICPDLPFAATIRVGWSASFATAPTRAPSSILFADALDFLGDAANYGVSLTALAAGLAWRSRVAPAHVDRLHFIRRCRGLDMSLAEIRSLLVFCDEPQRHCDDVNSVLDERIRHVDERIDELTRLSRELKQLRGVCRAPGTAGNCRILNTLRSSGGTVGRSAGRRASKSRDR